MNIYIDIETYRSYNSLDEVPKKLRDQFIRRYVNEGEDPMEVYKEKAALYPEFGRIICISIGFETKEGKYKSKSFVIKNDDKDEVRILNEFSQVLEKFKDEWYLIGYNIRSFDIPFIIKRYIINNLPVPRFLRNLVYGSNFSTVKPWESRVIDLMDIYRGTSPRSTSLEVTCESLGIQSKSEDIDGTNMFLVPLDEMDLNDLQKYCEEDTEVCYLLHKKLNQLIYNNEETN